MGIKTFINSEYISDKDNELFISLGLTEQLEKEQASKILNTQSTEITEESKEAAVKLIPYLCSLNEKYAPAYSDELKLVGIVEKHNGELAPSKLIMCGDSYEEVKSKIQESTEFQIPLSYITEFNNIVRCVKSIDNGNQATLVLESEQGSSDLLTLALSAEERRVASYNDNHLLIYKVNETGGYDVLCNAKINNKDFAPENLSNQLAMRNITFLVPAVKSNKKLDEHATVLDVVSKLKYGVKQNIKLHTNKGVQELTETLINDGYRISRHGHVLTFFKSINENTTLVPICSAEVELENIEASSQCCDTSIEICPDDAIVSDNEEIAAATAMIDQHEADVYICDFVNNVNRTKLDFARQAMDIITLQGGPDMFFSDMPELLQIWKSVTNNETMKYCLDVNKFSEKNKNAYSILLAAFNTNSCNAKLCINCVTICDTSCDCCDNDAEAQTVALDLLPVMNMSAPSVSAISEVDEGLQSDKILDAESFIQYVEDAESKLNEIDDNINGPRCTDGVVNCRVKFNKGLNEFRESIDYILSTKQDIQD